MLLGIGLHASMSLFAMPWVVQDNHQNPGFGLLFLTVGLDVLTNRDDILSALFGSEWGETLQTWLSFAEEGAKVLSEGFFVVAFAGALRTAKAIPE